jgi:hypothetical protein
MLRLSTVYPVVSLDGAYDIADQIGLSSATTTITPCGLVGFLCATEKDAVHFVFRFNDVSKWPADDPDVLTCH